LEQGFTLTELIFAVVVVGILSAVAVVGIAGLTHKASTSVCTTSAQAATIASVAYYSDTHGIYPTRWSNLTTASPPVFLLAHGVTINTGVPTELDGDGWKLVMTGGGTTEPNFACS
jgi:prepilin-type N-terminal cleavage/methylation domain-containing protein